MKILYELKQIFRNLKHKFRMFVFNILDAFEQQFAHWYHFSINIKTDDNENEFVLPVFACMRERSHAESLMNQIQKDLIQNNLMLLASGITEITEEQKNSIIAELENQLAGQEVIELRAMIYNQVGQRNRPSTSGLFNEEDLNPTNLDSFTNYKLDTTVTFRMNILRNQGVPFHQIRDCFLVKLDKSKLK
ncbi:hypothetical protein [Flavobacterium sp. AG291]|uniref:hypothetical protein n=1 Tax=Flavobacterium sp. AG291 TaxID=2184000 RepID=UPI000E09EF15|nr:hypothetical protein [Flavobacterium sp. AG291]RDI13215.1 hypothetical protein DEU42_103125 [Flavobacterium sp. AG291]